MGKYRRCSEELKKEVIRLNLNEERTKKSLSDEHDLGAGTMTHSRAVHYFVEIEYFDYIKFLNNQDGDIYTNLRIRRVRP